MSSQLLAGTLARSALRSLSFSQIEAHTTTGSIGNPMIDDSSVLSRKILELAPRISQRRKIQNMLLDSLLCRFGLALDEHRFAWLGSSVFGS